MPVQAAVPAATAWPARRTATGKLLTPVASIRRASGRNTTGMTSKCPTTTILMSGHEVAALLDTGSEVTTVTETWAAAHLQDRSLQQAFLTLRAANGAEMPYSGILLVYIDIFGRRCPDVPVLVVKEPTELSMQQRKRRLPVLVGMNVLRSCFPPEPASASEVPSCLQAVVREVRLQQRTTTQGVARTTSRCHVPANSMTTLRVTGRQKPACHLLASPLAQLLPSPHQQQSIQPLRPSCQPVRRRCLAAGQDTSGCPSSHRQCGQH